MKQTQRHTQQQKCSDQTSSFEGRVYTYKYFPPLPTVPGCLKNRKIYRPVCWGGSKRLFISVLCGLFFSWLWPVFPSYLGRAFTSLVEWAVQHRSWEGALRENFSWEGGGISTPTWQCQSHGKCQLKTAQSYPTINQKSSLNVDFGTKKIFPFFT